MTATLVKNLASLTGAEILSKGVTFAAFAYVARIFGPAGFGYIEWSAAILMCASLIVDQGFNAYGAREIAREPGRTEHLLSEIVTARFLLALIGYLAIAAFAFVFVQDAQVFKLLLVYGLSLWALPLLLQWVFQGHDRMNVVALTQIIRQLTFAGVVLLLVRRADDLLIVGFAEVAGVSVAAGFSVWMYKRHIHRRLNLGPTMSIKLFKEGVPIGISQMFWVVRMFGATLILGLVATAEDIGYFAGALRILIALHTFVWLYYFNLFPSMSRSWMAGTEEFSGLIRNSIRLVGVASILIGIVWVALAPMLTVIAYGHDFVRSGPALQWMAGVWIAAAISGHYRFGLIAAGFQNKEMISSAVGAATAIIFVPVGYVNAGLGGAAAALFVAEVLVLLSSWYFARRSWEPRTSNQIDRHMEVLQEVVR